MSRTASRTVGADIRESLRRFAYLWTSILALLGFSAELGADPRVSTVSVRVEPLQEIFSADGPICVRLYVENTSSRLLLLPQGFYAVKSFGGEGLEFPETLMTASLRSPSGKLQAPNAEPRLGTFGIGPEAFTLLKPGDVTGFAWTMKRWPWLFSFAYEGSYTLNIKLQFDLPRWLERMQKDRNWMVSQEAVDLVAKYRHSLVSGIFEVEPVTIHVCMPGPGKSCPSAFKPAPSLFPHGMCQNMVKDAK